MASFSQVVHHRHLTVKGVKQRKSKEAKGNYQQQDNTTMKVQKKREDIATPLKGTRSKNVTSG
jgi:hypothetical protein